MFINMELMKSLKKDALEFGIELSDYQLKQFYDYYELLIEWNEKINLTAITDFNEVLKKHFLDSISLVKAVPLDGSFTLIDIGTGAGFPGIPIKIAFPNIKVTLLDSLNKRVIFLEEVISKLGLTEIEAIHGRAEDFAKEGMLRESFDYSVSRAVANLSSLCEFCLPYVKVGGMFISYKSEKAKEEMQISKNAIDILGGNIFDCENFLLPGTDMERNFVIIKKVVPTPLKYPRKAGTPIKKPL